MRKKILLCFMIFAVAKTYSQNYNISFAATGGSNTLDSVKVENMNQGTTLSLNGADILHLGALGISDFNSDNETVKVYPNPMQGQAEISFCAKNTGNNQLLIYDINGKVILKKNTFLTQGFHIYQVESLHQGMYFINIIGDNYAYSTKLISQYISYNEAKLFYLGSEKLSSIYKMLKSTNATINMAYSTGDNLRFTGYSGIQTAIVTDVPTSSKTITFSFVGSIPSLTTTSIANITANSANSGGNITADGGASITARGVCYSTTINPTTLNSMIISGSGTGLFVSNLTGLTVNTTYYVRAFAKNSVGTAYGNELSFNTIASFFPVIDYDGNLYDTVHIGKQLWLKQNLKVTNYNNGDAIPNVIDNYQWRYLTTGAYCNVNNDYNNIAIYGRYYNFYAVTDLRNLCPAGWHVASDTDWMTLTTYLEPYPGIKLKEAGISHWAFPSSGTNESGFTALPGGYRQDDGTFHTYGVYGHWWTSSYYVQTPYVIYRSIGYNENDVNNNYGYKTTGLSVRCIFNITLPTVTTSTTLSITSSTAVLGGKIISDGGAVLNSKGICYSTSSNPTMADSVILCGNGNSSFSVQINNLIPSTTYYYRSFAKNILGLSYGNVIAFNTIHGNNAGLTIVKDRDGNGYDTVQIGVQVWLKQNLKTTHYLNGDSISNITNYSNWNNIIYGAYCWYNNDTLSFKNSYGAMYNWYTVSDARKICPVGYHIPSEIDWKVLTDFLGVGAGGKLKEKDTTHWVIPNLGATNESGFTALPGGNRNPNGSCDEMRSDAYFWASNQYDSYYAWYHNLDYYSNDLINSYGPKNFGFSVRCVGDTSLHATLTTIEASSITAVSSVIGGNVESDGAAAVTARGICYASTPNPDIADDIMAAGSGTGAFTVTLINLNPSTIYYARAFATNFMGTAYGNQIVFTSLLTGTTAVTDIDGNAYDTVHIATQIWMKQNLKVKHFINGDLIPNISNNTSWKNLTSAAYCWYNNDSVNYKNVYGALYNWYTVADARQLCPVSFHIPTDNEWGILSTYLGAYTTSGNKLKELGITHWFTPNTGASNESRFTALPGGGRSYYNGAFSDIGNFGGWWSTTGNVGSKSIIRYLYATNTNIFRDSIQNSSGLSVRCISDITLAALLPSLNTSSVTTITTTSAQSGGNITSNGGIAITARGVCYSTSTNPTTIDSIISCGSGSGIFTASLTGLTINTNYYLKAYAINNVGTAYGNQINFKTLGLATLTTANVTSIMSISATSGGNITMDGGVSVTARGICYSTSANPTIANTVINSGIGAGVFVANLSGLIALTNYYVRAYATNSVGTAYGNQLSFTTTNTQLPSVSTIAASSVTPNSAVCGGNVFNDGGIFVSERGVCYNTLANPTVSNYIVNSGSGLGVFASAISNLTANTIYYVRAFATNNLGTAYGNEISFITVSCSNFTVTHYAGAVAAVTKTVTYGTIQTTLFGGYKCAITQNLGSDHQADSVKDATEESSGWYWQFNHKQGYKIVGTVLYPSTWVYPIDENNSWTVSNDPCALLLGTGWRIPTLGEWTLADNGWNNYNQTFASVLRIHPAGTVDQYGSFNGRGVSGACWSASQNGSTSGFALYFGSSLSSIGSNTKTSTNSIRCIKD